MKSTLALSALISTGLAASIPGEIYSNILRRYASPQPVCKFDEKPHTYDDSNAWSNLSKRDLSEKTWNPPSDLSGALDEVWKHEVETYSDALGFKNYGYDQVMDGKGKINYCVRWEGSTKVSAAQRTQVETAIRKQFNKWIAVLAGFDGFPYETVDVNVVGWAVTDASVLEGDVSGIQVYTDKDAEGLPECSPSCGRFFHQDNDYSGCAAGADRHYDQSLWLTPGMGGGAGGDWGQRVGQEYFMQAVDSDNIHIVLHEIGHTFALDDFYDWTPTGISSFIMLAGSATEITEFDAWMARDWWRNLKSRYNLSEGSLGSGSGSGSSGNGTSGGNSTTTPESGEQQQEEQQQEVPQQSGTPVVEAPQQTEAPTVEVPQQTESPSVEVPQQGETPDVEAPQQSGYPVVEPPQQGEQQQGEQQEEEDDSYCDAE